MSLGHPTYNGIYPPPRPISSSFKFGSIFNCFPVVISPTQKNVMSLPAVSRVTFDV